jgi:hypothetical protein
VRATTAAAKLDGGCPGRVAVVGAFLCGSAENEAEVRDLFDLLLCLVVDDETLRQRLQTRTTNAFGQNAEGLAAAPTANNHAESIYRRLGATIIDGTRPSAEVTDAVLAAAHSLSQ